MRRSRSTGPTGKPPSANRADSEKLKSARDQGILSFRDPEELRAARISEFTGLRDAVDSSITRSNVRKTVALSLFPQGADVKDPVGRAESALAHKLGSNRDQYFDLDLIIPALRLCSPDERIDVVAFFIRELGLEAVDGRIRPRNRPSKEDEVGALRKDLTAFAQAFLGRLDTIADDDAP